MNHSLLSAPQRRLLALVEAAARVFALVGYRRAQMSDIATEARVALGTPYRYAEGKAAYLHLAIRLGFGEDPLEEVPALPAANPAPEATLSLLKKIIDRSPLFPTLQAALDTRPPADVAGEVGAIVSEIYDTIAERQLGIRIVDRSAREWPELAKLFFEDVRRPLIDRITRYLERRSSASALPAPPDIQAAARFVLETCAWFAMHRHYDAAPQPFDDEGARATVVRLVGTALLDARMS